MEVCYVGIRRSDGRAVVVVEEMDLREIRVGEAGEIIDSGIAGMVSHKYLDPGTSQHLCNHSPDGFEWGYHGSGPAQLALAILLDAIRRGPSPWEEKMAERVVLQSYQAFKSHVICRFPKEGFRLPLSVVRLFLLLAANVSRGTLPDLPSQARVQSEKPDPKVEQELDKSEE
jgi:hypothetical protein